ncbi:MAG: D-glycerate dehydrogenase [Pirellulaceae bacterium]
MTKHNRRPRVFVSREIPKVGLQRIAEVAEMDVWPERMPPSREALLTRVAGCDGILTLLSDRVDQRVMDAAGDQLRVISNYAVGYNNIDVAVARDRNIAVGNTPDVLTDATADLAVALVLAAARRLKEAADQVRSGQWKTWEPTGLIGQDLIGRKLGIVGMGRIGLATARRLHGGWGMEIFYVSRHPKPNAEAEVSARQVSFEELLERCDFVSVHTDLNDETRQLFNDAAFNRMQPHAVLVNTARGGIVDQAALLRALREDKIFAAGLDVTDPEPLPASDPLLELDRCIVLPHIASATVASRNGMAVLAAENLLAGLAGKPLPHAV